MVLKHFYKGFVETKPDKSSTTKRKGKTEFTSFEEADQRWLNFGGVLSDDYILVDVDDDYENKYTPNEKLIDNKKSKTLLAAIKFFGWKCHVTKSPHGVHTIWKAPKQQIRDTSGGSTYCGAIVDYKAGKNNSYECVRRNGKYDETLIECDDPQVLPDLLLPHKNDLFDLATGGRNDALFRHQTPLFKLNDCDVEKTIKFINEYVLADPVATNELKIITREEALEGAKKFAATPVTHDEVGDMLIEENNYYYLDNYGVCSYDNGNITKPLEKLDLDRVVRCYNKKLKNKDVSEVINYIIAMSHYVEYITRFDYILPVENGMLDLRTGELKEYDDTIIVNKLPVVYDPVVTECKEFDSWLEDVTSKNRDNIERDDEAINMIYECVANGFSMNNRLNKMYILYGDTRNGKSTLSKFLAYFFGDRNILNADLSVLNGSDAEKYKAMLQHKRMWLGDDLDGARLDKTADLKKIITGEDITGRPIYGTPITVKPYCGLMMGCNGIPYIGNGNDVDAIMERVIFMHFKRYYGDSPITNIDDILHTETCKSYVLNKAIEAWRRIRSEGYTEYSTSMSLKRQYKNELNPYQRFVTTNSLEGLTSGEVWNMWLDFVNDEEMDDYYKLSKNKILKSIRQNGGYENILSHGSRRWCKIR